MDPTIQEVKAALDDMRKAFEEFKKVNDKRMEALAGGRSTSEYDEKLAKIAADLDKAEKVQQEYLKKLQLSEEKTKKLEAEFNRLALGEAGNDSGAVARRKAEIKAFDAMLRKGAADMDAEERKTLIVANDTTGGFLAPPHLELEIIKAEVLFSPMRSLVSTKTIGSIEYRQPKRTQTAAATRMGETQTRAETQNPAWGQVIIPAPEMYAEARVTFQNLEDSAFNLEELLKEEFSEQFGVKEGQEVISGNGVNQCLGILDANAAGPSTPIAYTPTGLASAIDADAFITLMHAVKTAYAMRGTWALNRTSLGAVRKLKDSQGRYIWEPGLSTALPPRILDAPYVECPDMPDIAANAFPVAFGDWKRAYTLVDRVGMSVTRDPYTLANVGQVKFSARRRVGGQVVLGEALRLMKVATA